MNLPFDDNKLSALMEDQGADVVLASSKENVQYLLGGYKFFFFAHKDAIGVSRYQPLVGLPKGAPDKAFYIGNVMEGWQQEVEPLWCPRRETTSGTAIRPARTRPISSAGSAMKKAPSPWRNASCRRTRMRRFRKNCPTPNSSTPSTCSKNSGP